MAGIGEQCRSPRVSQAAGCGLHTRRLQASVRNSPSRRLGRIRQSDAEVVISRVVTVRRTGRRTGPPAKVGRATARRKHAGLRITAQPD